MTDVTDHRSEPTKPSRCKKVRVGLVAVAVLSVLTGCNSLASEMAAKAGDQPASEAVEQALTVALPSADVVADHYLNGFDQVVTVDVHLDPEELDVDLVRTTASTICSTISRTDTVELEFSEAQSGAPLEFETLWNTIAPQSQARWSRHQVSIDVDTECPVLVAA